MLDFDRGPMTPKLMSGQAPCFQQTLAAGASFAVLASILSPLAALVSASKISNKPNLAKISAAAIRYGEDYDERIPIIANGPYSGVTNNGFLNPELEHRTDLWPLILLPYVKNIHVYQDPRRDDLVGIWRGPALGPRDPGYSPLANTFRNQNRFPCFGVNYIFLSPFRTSDVNSRPDPLGGINTVAESKSFTQAKNPAETVFYAVSDRGYVGTMPNDSSGIVDSSRGYFVINAPGMWDLNKDKYNFLLMWTGTNCSGDWCGDANTKEPGHQRRTNFFYMEKVLGGNNVAFLDGHVKFMTDIQLTAGTNYWQAKPRGDYGAGGAVITNKAAYLWDLDGSFYGLY